MISWSLAFGVKSRYFVTVFSLIGNDQLVSIFFLQYSLLHLLFLLPICHDPCHFVCVSIGKQFAFSFSRRFSTTRLESLTYRHFSTTTVDYIVDVILRHFGSIRRFRSIVVNVVLQWTLNIEHHDILRTCHQCEEWKIKKKCSFWT